MILAGAILLAFFMLVIPLPRAVGWLRYAVPIALLIAVVQVALEGPRWQMVPAYTLAVVFFLIWLFGIIIVFDHANQGHAIT
jgi:hypothetical protein